MLLCKMKLQLEDDISVYNFTSGLWNCEDINMIIQVILGQTLLIQHVGVTQCVNINKMVVFYTPRS